MKLLTCPVCGRETIQLYHVAGWAGEYCAACRPPDNRRQSDPFVEEVRGTVIGPLTTHFEFWNADNSRFISKIDEETEELAISWFKTQYPLEYKQGVRLRVFE